MKATLKNYRQSPRKTRLVADFVCGKAVSQALAELDFLGKRAALPIKKLIYSALSNAEHNKSKDKENLVIKSVTVDKGFTLKRFRPRAFGRSAGINKRTSNVTVVLEEKIEHKRDAEPAVKNDVVENKKNKNYPLPATN